MKQSLREVSTAGLIDQETVQTPQHILWGYVFAFLGTILFSSKAILIKLAYLPTETHAANALDAITLMALRLGFSAPIYILIFWWVMRRRRQSSAPELSRKDMMRAVILGILGYYICAWLDIEGLKYITAQLERLLLFTYPIFVFIFGAMFFGKPLTKGAVIAIMLAYTGVGLIFYGGDIATGSNVALGATMVLMCAAAFAMFQLLAKPMIGRLGSSVFTCCAMLGAGTAIFSHFLIENVATGSLIATLDLPPRIWLLGLSLAFFSTLIPSFLVNIALERIGPQATSALGMVSPIATIMLAIWLLGEPFGRMDAVGTSLTILGIGIYTWLDRRTQNQPSKSAPRHK